MSAKHLAKKWDLGNNGSSIGCKFGVSADFPLFPKIRHHKDCHQTGRNGVHT